MDHNGHDTLMRRYVGETYLTSSYILCYDSFKSDSTADKRSMIGNPDESRCLDPAPMKGSDIGYAIGHQIQMQFRCICHGSFGDKDDWKLFQ